jgi:hypothetical protein
MAIFLPASIAMEQLAELSGHSPSDPAVLELFDRLVTGDPKKLGVAPF